MKETFILTSAQVRDKAAEMVRGLTLDPVHEVVVRPYRKDRTLAQNATLHLWMTVVSQWAGEHHGKFFPSSHWKEYFKQMFLGEETIRIGKRVITRTVPTSSLKVKQFAELLDSIDHYVGAEFEDCDLPHSDDNYYLAMGVKR